MKIVLLLATLSLPGLCVGAPEALQGVWQHHDFSIEYRGFMQNYACDELAEKLEILLRASGARSDLHISTSCLFPNHPSSGATAHISFFTLALSAAATDGANPVAGNHNVASQWHKVNLRYGSPSDLRAMDCELLAQFRDQMLPLFTTRNVVDHTHCTLGEAHPGDLDLQFEVMVPTGSN